MTLRYQASGLRAVDPILALSVFSAAASANIAMTLALHGPNATNANSCASGALAIGQAFDLIRRGGAPFMLAGGAETPLAPLTFGSFALIHALSTHNATPETASRPFDATRDGFVMAEGAAVLLLEELDHALARHAPIYAELAGFATTTDAFHMTAPLPSGAQVIRVMRTALAKAGIAPAEVGYVNVHGSGTPLGDRVEVHARREVFGADGAGVPMSGTKALTGHALGATGALEAAASPGAAPRLAAACVQYRRARPGLRSAVHRRRRPGTARGQYPEQFVRLWRPQRGPGPAALGRVAARPPPPWPRSCDPRVAGDGAAADVPWEEAQGI